MNKLILLVTMPIWQASAHFGKGYGGGNGGGRDDVDWMGGGGKGSGRGGMGGGGGWGKMDGGGKMGGGGGGMGGMGGYGEMIHNLFYHHKQIQRDSNNLDNGIEAYTYSDDEVVAGWIKEHVREMKELLDSDGSIREWDDLFSAAFELRDFHDMTVEYLDNGVRVVQFVADDVDEDSDAWDCAKAIIQAHAGVVDNFVKYGMAEAEKSHAVPTECDAIV